MPGSAVGHSNNVVSSLAPSSIELISRGPNGHFVVQSPSSNQISALLDLDEEKRKPPPFVFSVDLPAHNLVEACPLLQPHLEYDPYADGLSTCSRSSWVTLSNRNQAIPITFPVLPHIRSSMVQPSMTSSTLLLQMKHERERGNLSHCLKLAQERNELEKELQKYTLERRNPVSAETQRQGSEDGGYRFSGKSRSATLPRMHTLGGRARVGIPPSPFSLSSVNGEADTHVSSPTLAPVLDETSAPVSRSPDCVMTSTYSSTSSSLNASLLQSEQMGKLTLSHPSSESGQHEMAQAVGTAQSPPLSLPDTSRDNLGIWGIAFKNGCVEMSVDGPELEVSLKQLPLRPMLHQKIASHLEHGSQHTRLERCGAINRRATFSGHSPKSPHTLQFCKTKLVRDVSQSRDINHRSKSLDFRRRKANFLTPEAWISSLSQETHSLSSSHYLEPSSLVPEVSGSTANALLNSTVADPSCQRNSLEMHNDVFYHDDNELLADWPTAHHEVAGRGEGSLEGTEGILTAGLPHCADQEVLEVEAEDLEGVPDSGSSYSSYASSGRGSMEQAGGRLSLCCLSPVLSTLPETVGRSLENMDEHGSQTEASLRYK